MPDKPNLLKMIHSIENAETVGRTIEHYINSIYIQNDEVAISRKELECCLTDIYKHCLTLNQHIQNIKKEWNDTVRPAII